MNAPEQLSMFEPEGVEAMSLLSGFIKEQARFELAAERYELRGMRGASRVCRALAVDAEGNVVLLATLLEFEREAGL